MKLLQFIDPQDGGQVHVGLIEGEQVIDLTQTPAAPHSVYDIYYRQGGDEVGEDFSSDEASDSGLELQIGMGAASMALNFNTRSIAIC